MVFKNIGFFSHHSHTFAPISRIAYDITCNVLIFEVVIFLQSTLNCLTMKKYLLIAFLGIMTFTGCIEEDDPLLYPTITIMNEIGDTSRNDITSLDIVNYQFYQLSVAKGDSLNVRIIVCVYL